MDLVTAVVGLVTEVVGSVTAVEVAEVDSVTAGEVVAAANGVVAPR